MCTIKKSLTCCGFFFLLFLITPFESKAADTIEIDYRHVGLYSTGGPNIQYDMTSLKKPLYGVVGQFGYRFNEKVSTYLQVEGLANKIYSSYYLYFPATANVKVGVYRDFFIHAGAGYSLMYVTGGNHFGRGTTLPKKTYNGFVADGGVAYEWWFEDDYFLSPEFGVQFNHIANDNRVSPYLRLNVGFAVTWFDRI